MGTQIGIHHVFDQANTYHRSLGGKSPEVNGGLGCSTGTRYLKPAPIEKTVDAEIVCESDRAIVRLPQDMTVTSGSNLQVELTLRNGRGR